MKLLVCLLLIKTGLSVHATRRESKTGEVVLLHCRIPRVLAHVVQDEMGRKAAPIVQYVSTGLNNLCAALPDNMVQSKAYESNADQWPEYSGFKALQHDNGDTFASTR